jgi:hypothetical protein
MNQISQDNTDQELKRQTQKILIVKESALPLQFNLVDIISLSETKRYPVVVDYLKSNKCPLIY